MFPFNEILMDFKKKKKNLSIYFILFALYYFLLFFFSKYIYPLSGNRLIYLFVDTHHSAQKYK